MNYGWISHLVIADFINGLHLIFGGGVRQTFFDGWNSQTGVVHIVQQIPPFVKRLQ